MIRIITQILIGLMLLFGVVTLTPRSISYFRRGIIVRALFLLLLAAITFFFSVLAFYFAYGGIREL